MSKKRAMSVKGPLHLPFCGDQECGAGRSICLLYAEWSQVGEVTLRRGCTSPTLKELPTKGTKGGPLGLGRQEPSPCGSEESPRECSVESAHVLKSIQIQVLDLRQDTGILETVSSSNKPW